MDEFLELFDKLPGHLKGKCKQKECPYKEDCCDDEGGDYLLDFGYLVDINNVKQFYAEYMCAERWPLFKVEKSNRDIIGILKRLLNKVMEGKG